MPGIGTFRLIKIFVTSMTKVDAFRTDFGFPKMD